MGEVLQQHYWGSGSQLHDILRLLAHQGFNYTTCIDVGAVEYTGEKHGKGDSALAVEFYRLFLSPTRPSRVLAFEPNKQNALYAKAERCCAGEVRVSSSLVSAHRGTIELRGRANRATTNPRLFALPKYAKGSSIRLSATTIDHEAAANGLEMVDVLKTDTEGCEWEVLQGARRLLEQRRVRVLLVAYEDKWSADTFFGAYPTGGRAAAPNVSAMEQPTLRSVTRYLEAVGFVSHLLGTAQQPSSSRPVQLIPLSEGCWDDAFEIARNPKRLGLQYTWMDFVAMARGSAEDELLRHLAATACGAP